MVRFVRVIAIANLLTLVACSGLYDRFSPQETDVRSAVAGMDLQAHHPKPVRSADGKIDGIRPHAQTFMEDDAADDGAASPIADAGASGSGGYDVDFQAIPIEAAARSVLGDILKVNYEIDSRVQGTVTLASGRPLQDRELLGAFEASLQTAGAALLREKLGYRIVPIDEAPGRSRIDVSSSVEPGFGITALPLKYVSAETIQKLIDGLSVKSGSTRVISAKNVLLIQGTSADRQTALDSALSFDQNWMKGQSVGIFPLANSAPDVVITELRKIMDSGEAGANQTLLQFQTLARMNAILVIAKRQELIKTAAKWIERLDRSDSAANAGRVYRVKYGDAKQMAGVLNDAFGNATGSTAMDGFSDLNRKSDPSMLGMQSGASGQMRQDQGQPTADNQGNPAPLNGAGVANTGIFGTNAVLPSGSFGATEQANTATRQDTKPDGQRIRITADPLTNSLLIFANQEAATMIERLIERLDRPRLQVAIEATIAEVSLNDSLQFGVQYYLKGGNNVTSGSVSLNNAITQQSLGQALPGFNFLLGAQSDPSTILSALSSKTNVKVLSNPSLVVLDNQIASLQVGDQIPVATTQATLVGASSLSGTTASYPVVNNIDYRNTGVILKVLPRVSANGNVTLEIEQEISNVVNNANSGTLTPSVSERRVKSSVVVASGQTVLLAGLISDQEQSQRSGIPMLEKITLLGDLFAKNQTAANRTELIIFIRPHIIQEAVDAQEIAEQMRQKMLGAGLLK